MIVVLVGCSEEAEDGTGKIKPKVIEEIEVNPFVGMFLVPKCGYDKRKSNQC